MSKQLQTLFDKLPPHSVESEMVYLGSCLTDLSALDRTAHIIESAEAFYDELHQGIYRVLLGLSHEHTQVDLTTAAAACKKAGLDFNGDMGCGDYLLNLAQSVRSTVLAEGHAKTIRRHWKSRRIVDLVGDAMFQIYNADREPAEVIDSLTDNLAKIAGDDMGGDIRDAHEIALSVARKIKTGETENFMPTGFRTIDAWLRGGIRAGEVMVIGGRPGQGKTALGVNMLLNAAKAGSKVAFITIEMSPEGIVRRMMGPSIYVADQDSAYANAMAAVKRLEQYQIPIVNLSSGSLGEMRRHVRTLVRTRQIDGIAVDYLQLVTADGVSKEYERISHVSTAIKRMAREYNLSVLNLAQINRDGGKKERPTMSDLKGSGSIEQDADQIVLIHNPVAYGDFEEPPELIVAKHRNGRTGSVVVDYLPEETRFEEVQ